jgi:hypothetical protein
MAEFIVIPAKAYQRVMDSGSPLRYGWNGEFSGHWVFSAACLYSMLAVD